jgi:hypothetical protein
MKTAIYRIGPFFVSAVAQDTPLKNAGLLGSDSKTTALDSYEAFNKILTEAKVTGRRTNGCVC